MLQPHLSGPWSISQIESYLNEKAVPLKLSVISSGGWPVIVSLWFVFDENRIICASRKKSKIIKFLETNPRCAFEVSGESPPYSGVRGQGIAMLSNKDSHGVLERLHDRFLGMQDTPFKQWLLKNSENETIISIEPKRLMTWDYSTRMSKSG
jgi:nitroimidazol reductase NimA-like FMN-containing flavoprotein (pyridoxamine 5'-phosphate oxidase superfamily)